MKNFKPLRESQKITREPFILTAFSAIMVQRKKIKEITHKLSKFFEYKYNCEIATRLVADLCDRGFDAEHVVPELDNISIAARCRPVNAWCDALGSNNIQKQCGILGMSRTANYYKPKGKSKKNLQIRQGTHRIPSQGRSNGCIIA